MGKAMYKNKGLHSKHKNRLTSTFLGNFKNQTIVFTNPLLVESRPQMIIWNRITKTKRYGICLCFHVYFQNSSAHGICLSELDNKWCLIHCTTFFTHHQYCHFFAGSRAERKLKKDSCGAQYPVKTARFDCIEDARLVKILSISFVFQFFVIWR